MWAQFCATIFRSLAPLCSLVVLYAQTTYAERGFPIPTVPPLQAKAALLLDYSSGTILAAYNADTPLYPASLTKLMTSYVVSQAIQSGAVYKHEQVTVSPTAWSKYFATDSKMFLKVGEKVSVETLHKGVIISSGNDACVALAEHIAGSESAFVNLMNNYAARLRLQKTRFYNVHGLDHPEQYTTARDMAMLTAAFIREFPHEYSLYKEKQFTYNGIVQNNRNGLLWDSILNVDGVKTGHTLQAGYNLITSITTGQTRLIAVVLGAASVHARESESKRLLQWGLRFFETVLLHNSNTVVASVPVWMANQRQVKLTVAQPCYITFPRGRRADLVQKVVIAQPLKAPLACGKKVGTLQLFLDGQVVAQYPLQVMDSIQRGHLMVCLADRCRLWLQDHLHVGRSTT